MFEKLRLIVTYQCHRKCEGCCNKNLPQKPKPMSLKKVLRHPAKEVYLTGGEPMLIDSVALGSLAEKLKGVGKKVFMYSAEPRFWQDWVYLADVLDGITMTIHTKRDLRRFDEFYRYIEVCGVLRGKSLRLNVFEDVMERPALIRGLMPMIYPDWDVRPVEWRKDCPIPPGEDFGEMVML